MVRKVGVEEELLLVDPDTRRLADVAERTIRRASEDGGDPVEAELFLQQVETQTAPSTDLDELDRLLRRTRQAVCGAAESAGARAVAVGTPVLGKPGQEEPDTDTTRGPRYQLIREQYGELARSALACALHVHVDVDDADEGVRVVDTIAPWLPLLLALSANSPYAWGRDTGHASWRSQIWSRWPSHGTGEPFGDLDTYTAVTDQVIAWGAALDRGMTYLAARLAQDYPTVEVRVADVCTDPELTILVAALSRGLVETAATGEAETWRSELLRAAGWRAARYGVAERLVDPATRELVPARDAIDSLVEHVRPALEEAGDLDRVRDTVERVLGGGHGAVAQRRVWEETGSLEAVVDDLADRTANPR